eukprot:CAMPEP_0172532590 /NCGR_PEP_ID=MMETSP1067-20121228/5587_1 /TAXON_ID=265564 ORGANISM="Thalassiosira punctigera, Strain Tpunct2005C2" /NCGR_SAMPLE_ID=MMETSP1067 /ASSEMBLY_ACC=CAM_ASM_000444 /LENGTH=38 /DNA_ID= /DNA_START= /DNA_END= /DNA_ORIENTATION=
MNSIELALQLRRLSFDSAGSGDCSDADGSGGFPQQFEL